MIPVSKLREDFELILDRRGERAQSNGAVIYNENGLRIQRDCDGIEVHTGGELVVFEPSASSRKTRFLELGDGEWVNEIRELAKEITSGTRR